MKPEEISAVSITDFSDSADGKSWSVSRMGNGDDVVWNVSGGEVDLDEGKANSWLASFASLSTRDWYDEKEVLEGTKTLSARITYNYKDIKLEIFALPKANENDRQQYYGTCSETPYRFKVNESDVKQYLKTLEELAK